MEIQNNEMKYSVLMSVYKNEDPFFLSLSIESMVSQTLKPNEIVIVKDGPLPDTLEDVIKNFVTSERDLFTVVPLNVNLGLGLALNEGLKKCRNELVARMDTDDISLPERCEIQVSEFQKNKKLCIAGSAVDEFVSDPNEIISSRVVPTKHKDILKFSRRRNPFTHPSVMYKKSKVLSCGGYNDYRRNQDLDLFVRMLNQGCIAMNIDKSLLLFRANEDNLKRRKSWEKCSSYIGIIYSFWKKGYSSLTDVIIITTSQLIIFLMPSRFLGWLSKNYLRKRNL